VRTRFTKKSVNQKSLSFGTIPLDESLEGSTLAGH